MSSEQHSKNPERVAAGLKASIKNPNVSEEAKAHAAERLHELEKTESAKHVSGTSKNEGQSAEPSSRQLGGYKATLHNEHTSPEAKQHAREILTAHGYPEFEEEASKESKEHMTRVLAGYKAALHNPNVSHEAKEHAREFLKEHDAL